MPLPADNIAHTDIARNGWISRMPPFLRPYLLLARLDRPIGTWLLLLPGWWAIALAARGQDNKGHALWLMLLFGVGAVIMRAAGCVINDLWDRRLDQKVGRTQQRPLAAGTVTPFQALVFLALLMAAGLLILCQLPRVTILLGILAVPLIVIYPLAKRFTWWPQLVLGLIFNFGALMGWAAMTGRIALPAILLYVAGIFWTLGYDTIYAHQDRDDDRAAGIKSTALKFGVHSKRWVSGFYTAAWIFLIFAFCTAHVSGLSFGLLILPAAQLIYQIKSWNPDNAPGCLTTFRSNRDFGLLVLLAALI